MKYAKEFQKLLEAYPPEWVGTAMHYSGLKKCLKSVRKDLEKHGLDKKTLGELRAAGVSAEYPSAVRYSLDGSSAVIPRSLRHRSQPLCSDGLGCPETLHRCYTCR